MKTRAVSIAAVLIAAAAIAGCGSSSYDSSASATEANSEGTELVTRLFEDVKTKNKADLEKFLTPNWQLQRATGAPLTKSEFIDGLPELSRYKIEQVKAREYDDSMSVAFVATTDLVVDGTRFPGTPAPYLSSFIEVDDEWYLLSHANLNKPK